MEIAMIGLGRMGLNMCKRLLRGSHTVFAYDRGRLQKPRPRVVVPCASLRVSPG